MEEELMTRKRKRPKNAAKKTTTIELEMELTDIKHRYGRDEMIICSSDNNHQVPPHVMNAYVELSKLKQARGEHYPLIPPMKHVIKKVNEESSSAVNERCFEFVQKLIMKTSRVVDMMNGGATFGGIYA